MYTLCLTWSFFNLTWDVSMFWIIVTLSTSVSTSLARIIVKFGLWIAKWSGGNAMKSTSDKDPRINVTPGRVTLFSWLTTYCVCEDFISMVWRLGKKTLRFLFCQPWKWRSSDKWYVFGDVRNTKVSLSTWHCRIRTNGKQGNASATSVMDEVVRSDESLTRSNSSDSMFDSPLISSSLRFFQFWAMIVWRLSMNPGTAGPYGLTIILWKPVNASMPSPSPSEVVHVSVFRSSALCRKRPIESDCKLLANSIIFSRSPRLTFKCSMWRDLILFNQNPRSWYLLKHSETGKSKWYQSNPTMICFIGRYILVSAARSIASRSQTFYTFVPPSCLKRNFFCRLPALPQIFYLWLEYCIALRSFHVPFPNFSESPFVGVEILWRSFPRRRLRRLVPSISLRVDTLFRIRALSCFGKIKPGKVRSLLPNENYFLFWKVRVPVGVVVINIGPNTCYDRPIYSFRGFWLRCVEAGLTMPDF